MKPCSEVLKQIKVSQDLALYEGEKRLSLKTKLSGTPHDVGQMLLPKRLWSVFQVVLDTHDKLLKSLV